jgi:nucleotide-binding universal stress UspA family protein
MYKHVMVPLDGSELAECVLPHVRAIAVGCNVTKVTVVRVVEPLPVFGNIGVRISPEEKEQLDKQSIDEAKDYLERIVKSLQETGVAAEPEVLGSDGDIASRLIDYGNANEVDLVIISTHGRSGITRWVWGSVAERILHGVCVPVTMVRAPGCFPGV